MKNDRTKWRIYQVRWNGRWYLRPPQRPEWEAYVWWAPTYDDVLAVYLSIIATSASFSRTLPIAPVEGALLRSLATPHQVETSPDIWAGTLSRWKLLQDLQHRLRRWWDEAGDGAGTPML